MRPTGLYLTHRRVRLTKNQATVPQRGIMAWRAYVAERRSE